MARPATDIKQRLLRAAREAFDRRGVDAVSLRAIAARARTTIGMIYYYFPTKDDLFEAVVEDVYARVLPDLAAALATDQPLRAKLAAVMRRLAGGSDAERTVMRIAVRDMLVSPARRARLFARFQRGHIPLVLAAISHARVRGELRTDAPVVMQLFAAGAVAVFGSLVLEHLPLPGVPPSEERIEIALHLLFDGISADCSLTSAK
jgi:AcrR family transcriptional regulator